MIKKDVSMVSDYNFTQGLLFSQPVGRPGLPVPHHLPELPKFMSITSVILSRHLIIWCPLLLLPSNFPSIRDFSNELAVHIRKPKCWSFSFSIGPSNEYSGLISLKFTGLVSLLSKGLSGIFSSTTVRRHQFFDIMPSLWSSSYNHTWLLKRPQPWLYGPCLQSDVFAF